MKNYFGDDPEFLWEKYDDCAVFRRKDTMKWYAVLMTIPKSKLGFDSDESIEIIDLHISPDELDALVDEERYFRGYHMNKRHWYTIVLDGSIPTEELYARIIRSHDLK